jgi:hypothetical protein
MTGQLCVSSRLAIGRPLPTFSGIKFIVWCREEAPGLERAGLGVAGARCQGNDISERRVNVGSEECTLRRSGILVILTGNGFCNPAQSPIS